MIKLLSKEDKVRFFEASLGDILLLFRARKNNIPILGIYQEISSQYIDRKIGKGHNRESLVISPAITLEEGLYVYGKFIPKIKFQNELSFGLGTEIDDIFIGKEAILSKLNSLENFKDYIPFFAHLPEQRPYDGCKIYLK